MDTSNCNNPTGGSTNETNNVNNADMNDAGKTGSGCIGDANDTDKILSRLKCNTSMIWITKQNRCGITIGRLKCNTPTMLTPKQWIRQRQRLRRRWRRRRPKLEQKQNDNAIPTIASKLATGIRTSSGGGGNGQLCGPIVAGNVANCVGNYLRNGGGRGTGPHNERNNGDDANATISIAPVDGNFAIGAGCAPIGAGRAANGGGLIVGGGGFTLGACYAATGWALTTNAGRIATAAGCAAIGAKCAPPGGALTTNAGYDATAAGYATLDGGRAPTRHKAQLAQENQLDMDGQQIEPGQRDLESRLTQDNQQNVGACGWRKAGMCRIGW